MELVDIYDGNPEPNWDELADHDVVGVYLKLGEGTSDIGGRLSPARAARARSAGLFVGFYWFARPDLGHTPAAEADAFVVRLNAITKSSDLRPSLDLDAAPIDAFDGNAGAWGASFLDELEKAYPRTLWYSDASHALKLSEMFGRWAWIAFYGANDGGFHPLDLANFPVGVLAQQYTSVGVIGRTFTGDVSRLRHGRPARLLARR